MNKSVFSIIAALATVSVLHANVYKPNVAQVGSRVGPYTKTSVIDKDTTTYSPQAGWHIVAYRVYDQGSFGVTSYTYGSNPSNYYAQMTNELQNISNDAFQLSAQANLPPDFQALLDAYITTSFNYYSAYVSQFSSSHATIWANTEARGRGRLVSRGSSISVGIDTWEVQCIPVCQNPQAMRQQFINSVNMMIQLLKRRAPQMRRVNFTPLSKTNKAEISNTDSEIAKVVATTLGPVDQSLTEICQWDRPGIAEARNAMTLISGETKWGPIRPLPPVERKGKAGAWGGPIYPSINGWPEWPPSFASAGDLKKALAEARASEGRG